MTQDNQRGREGTLGTQTDPNTDARCRQVTDTQPEGAALFPRFVHTQFDLQSITSFSLFGLKSSLILPLTTWRRG